MRFLHCSDIHLGRRPVGGVGEFSRKRYEDYFDAFAWAVGLALDTAVDAFVITGDLFDRKELVPEVLERTEQQLGRLAAAAMPVVLVEGNHDNITAGKESDSWLVYLENKGLVRRPTYRVDETGYRFEPFRMGTIDFYGLGYPGGMADETLRALAAYLHERGSARNVVLVHTAIASGDFLPGVVTRESVDCLKDYTVYIGGGHFHSYQVYPSNDPRFFIPGSLEYWDLAEKAGAKGVIIFDTETRDHTFTPSSPRDKITIRLHSSAETEEAFREEFVAGVRPAITRPGEELAFAEVALEKPLYVDTLWCEEALARAGALKGFVRIRYPGEQEGRAANRAESSVEEVERELIEQWEIFGGGSADTARALETLKQYQKENNREQFFESFDRLLDLFAGERES